ncbi:MAG: hypothetical protein ABIH09_02095 [Candidatus Omnitrophota bacterium]
MQPAKSKKKQENENVRLGDIIIDPSYQIRMKINLYSIAQYANAMKNGDIFPPIIIEKKTGKLVCGFTRLEAYQQVFPPDTMVPAVYVDFKNDCERILFAAKDNNTHGQQLSTWDRKNIIDRLVKVGASAEYISRELNWKIDKVEKVAGISVFTINAKDAEDRKAEDHSTTGKEKDQKKGKKNAAASVTPIRPEINTTEPYVVIAETGESKILKRGLEHIKGKTVSQQIYQYISTHYSGWTDRFHVEQLIQRFEYGLVNLKDEETKQSLSILVGLIEKANKATRTEKTKRPE